MPIEIASAVGISSKVAWSTTATVRSAGGVLYLAAGFSGSEQAPHEGREFISQLHQNEFTDGASVYRFLQDYYQQLNNEVAISWSCLWVAGESSILMTFGFAKIGLLRAGQGRWIINGQQDAVILEGEVKPSDKFLLSTARITDLSLPLASWSNSSTDEIAGELVEKVRSTPQSAELAVLVVEQTSDTSSSISSPAERITNSVQPNENEQISTKQTIQKQNLSSIKAQHLISPQKLAAGIVATDQEQSHRWQQQRKSQWLQRLNQLASLSWLRVVVVIVLIGALLGGLFTWRMIQINQEKKEVVVPLQEKVSNLQQLPTDNKLQIRDEANALQERLQATRVKYGANQKIIDNLLQDVNSLFSSVSGEQELVNLPVFYDFRLAVANFLATSGHRDQGQAAFLDANEQKIIHLDLENKSNETAQSEFIKGGRDLVLLDQQALVLREDSISQVPINGSNADTFVDLSDDVSDPVLMDRYGDNLYIVDQADAEIWRVVASIEASASGWIRSAPGIDFSEISSVSIDGDIWLGSNQGEIYRLRRGSRVDFEVAGLLEPFTSALLVAASEEGEVLVVVEPASQRLVVLNKDGVYQRQVISEQIGGVTDILVDEAGQVTYLVAGSVIYEVEI